MSLQLKYSETQESIGGPIDDDRNVPRDSFNSSFGNIDEDEAADGSVKHQCWYVKNEGTQARFNIDIEIKENTPSDFTLVEIGAGTAGVNGVEQTIAGKEGVPSGVSFDVQKVPVPNLQPGEHYGFWLRRTLDAGNDEEVEDDFVTIRLNSET